MNCVICSRSIRPNRYYQSVLKLDGTILYYCCEVHSQRQGPRTPGTGLLTIDYSKDKRDKQEVLWHNNSQQSSSLFSKAE